MSEILAAIQNLNISTGNPNAGTSMLTPIDSSTITVSVANWNQATPAELSAITDGNSETASTWGQIQGGGNSGWFQFDLGNGDRRYTEVKIGIRMAPGHEGGNTEPFVMVSDDNVVFMPIVQTRITPTGTERILTIPFWFTSRYLRVGVLDNGGGQPQLKVYDLKAWKLTI